MLMQSCPELEKQACTAWRAAASTSASASTTIGFLPPSSAEKPMSRRPHCSAMIRPVAVDPVNMRKSTAPMRLGPSTGPSPVTTWKSSRGRPASYSSSTAASAVNGVWRSGFSTTALPASSAATASEVARVRG